ncbi:MAG TPA: DUF5343 domain-containing protein [Terracidiphilus sp.]|nr:DUF5343 domain-containing protein [Terracidiphilus sp.]
MSDSIPYVAAPGSIRTALEKIAEAATPDRVTGDFIQTVLGIKGGTGRAIIPFLKKIGMVRSDGSPTDLYNKYRNKSTSRAAIASAVRAGYKRLAETNEYFYRLNDADLKELLVQVTGGKRNSSVVNQIFGTLKILKNFADFETAPTAAPSVIIPNPEAKQASEQVERQVVSNGLGLNLSYTINLNLPATSDQAVFNAIFRSLKEFLITNAKG